MQILMYWNIFQSGTSYYIPGIQGAREPKRQGSREPGNQGTREPGRRQGDGETGKKKTDAMVRIISIPLRE